MGRTTSPRLSRRGETQLGWSFGVAMTDTLAADSGSAASHDSASPSNVPLKDLLIAKGGPRSCAFVPRPSPLPNARCQRSRLDEVRLNSYGRASPSCRRRARSSAFERAPTAAPRTVPATSEPLPQRPVPCLRRGVHGLEPALRERPDWRAILVLLSRRDDFWPQMAKLAESLHGDPHIEADLGVSREEWATPLWRLIGDVLVTRYGGRRCDWTWDEALASSLIAEWRATHASEPVPHQTIAPLHNVEGPDSAVRIDDDLVLRPMTDDERDALWRHFGDRAGPVAATVAQLEWWTHVLDFRWRQPRTPPHSDEVAVRRIANTVTALRLFHPGVAGTSVLWTRLDPPDAPFGRAWTGQSLSAPHGSARYLHPLKVQVAPLDARRLRRLVREVERARDNRLVALALRRFDSAYERYEQTDALIDLWIAFEALLVPDGTSELRYRAALRIARLAGPEPSDRENAFAFAKRSYDVRSKVVHGTAPPDDLGKVLEETRQLARVVLERWICDPPQDGVQGLDRSLLA